MEWRVTSSDRSNHVELLQPGSYSLFMRRCSSPSLYVMSISATCDHAHAMAIILCWSQGHGSVPCVCTSQSAHIGQTNWTLKG